ncbi:hypothetical protein QYE76_035187 [Lolium multiflorum]|uniref:Retrotransposon gag domain-containing protein n=1 Tax=Lolium multiflorum TaxID=4521 RepID=A0AAD8R139_LOLMU|nr:hypothetical protein QYE76_035187 [Lolium multiflorum]
MEEPADPVCDRSTGPLTGGSGAPSGRPGGNRAATGHQPEKHQDDAKELRSLIRSDRPLDRAVRSVARSTGCSVELWEIILHGYREPQDPVRLTSTEFYNRQLNASARDKIRSGINRKLLDQVNDIGSAKELWDRIVVLQEGTDLIQSSLYETAKQEAHRFMIREGESLADAYARLGALKVRIKGLGAEKYDDGFEMNEGFIKSKVIAMIAVKQEDTNLALNLQIMTKSADLNSDDLVSYVADTSKTGSLGSFLDATIAKSRQIENTETPNAATPVNSPESVEYSSDDLDEDYVELDNDFIEKCKATTDARKIKKLLAEHAVRYTPSPDPKFATSPINIRDKDYDFSLDLSHIAIVEKTPFCGTEKESAVEHLTELSTLSGVFSDDVKMRTYFVAKIFPFSLKDDAKTWYNNLPPGSIKSPTDLRDVFFRKYFPASAQHAALQRIYNFDQEDGEKLPEAWARFCSLIRAQPDHDLEKHDLLDIFYSGLTIESRAYLDSCAGCVFRKRTPEDAEELLAKIGRNHDDWSTPEPTPTPIVKKRGMIKLNDEDMREAKKSLKEKGIKPEDVKNLPPIEDICETIPPSSMIEYMKDIVTNKRKVPNEEISTMLANYSFNGKIPKKLGDPDKLIPTDISLQMADKSTAIPVGLCENVPVQVTQHCLILTDFVVLEMPEDDNMSIILGRPFLNTAGAVIDCNKGMVTFNVDDKEHTVYFPKRIDKKGKMKKFKFGELFKKATTSTGRPSRASTQIRRSYNEDVIAPSFAPEEDQGAPNASSFPCYEFLTNAGLLDDFFTLVNRAGLATYVGDERGQYYRLTKIFVESFKFHNTEYEPTVAFKIYDIPVTMKLEEFCFALGIAPVGTARRIDDNPRDLLELYRGITGDDCRTIQRGKIRNIQLPAIKYFAYYVGTSILGRENTSNISSYHLAFLNVALTGETPYHLGSLIARRLSSRGPIFGGTIASRILTHLDIPLDSNDVPLTPRKLDIAAMKSHHFVTTNSTIDNIVYKMLFADGNEKEIPLPQQGLFNIDRQSWSLTKEVVEEHMKIQEFHQQHDSENAEPSYDYTVTYPDVSSSTYMEPGRSSSYYEDTTSWGPWE